MLVAYTFSNGTTAHRILVGHPKMPLYADGIFVLNLARMGGWLAVFGLMVAIYFLYMKYTKGIYLAKIAATSAMVAGFATYYWRHDTVDYGRWWEYVT